MALFLLCQLSTLLPKLVIGVTSTPIIPTLPNLLSTTRKSPHRRYPSVKTDGTIGFAQHCLLFFLYKTSFGLFCACRREPDAPIARAPTWSDALFFTILGEAFIALAGVYLPMVYGNLHHRHIRGRWISIALTLRWSPIPFSGTCSAGIDVSWRSKPSRRDWHPYQFCRFPFIATILVMLFSYRRARVPAFGRITTRETFARLDRFISFFPASRLGHRNGELGKPLLFIVDLTELKSGGTALNWSKRISAPGY
jgi:ABC-type uncharacterized transport system permease subunit